MSDRTLVLLKPDAVERKLVGEIVSRFEAKNLDIVAMDLRQLDAELLGRHYAEHVGKGFYDDLVAFMSRGPVVAMVVEGPEDTWDVVRQMMGATNPRKAAPGTIRGDLGIFFTENLVHGSDSLESATREIGIYFPNISEPSRRRGDKLTRTSSTDGENPDAPWPNLCTESVTLCGRAKLFSRLGPTLRHTISVQGT